MRDRMAGREIRALDAEVVGRIAAGEVIQRPANVVKELVENALDAQSTTISVTIKNGGMDCVHVVDNGSGLSCQDLPLACQRFTTSKLTTFDDLSTMTTFGFRGEALASISHVARVSIVSRTIDSVCAYKADYVNGKCIEPGVKAVAANNGTSITASHLFHNMETRRCAMLKSARDEATRIRDIVARYALHYSGKCAFAFFKDTIGSGGGCHKSDSILMQRKSSAVSMTVNTCVRTTMNSSVSDNIALLFGSNIAKHLLIISDYDSSKVDSDAHLKFRFSAHMTHPNFNIKSCGPGAATAAIGTVAGAGLNKARFQLILFINDRLVECGPLRKAISATYTAYLPKGSHPFVYLAMDVEPRHVDVNVHPTKHEVIFLNQDHIVQVIQREIDAKLKECDRSRAFAIRQVGLSSLSSSPRTATFVDDTEAQNVTGDIRRVTNVNASNGTDAPGHRALLSTIVNEAGSNSGSTNNVSQLFWRKPESGLQPHQLVRTDSRQPTLLTVQAGFQFANPTATSVDGEVASGFNTSSKRRLLSPNKPVAQLTSVKELMAAVGAATHQKLHDIILHHTFVGCVNHQLALIQHSTDLYLVDSVRMSRSLFYQLALRRFGVMPTIDLRPAVRLRDLIEIALNSTTGIDSVCQTLSEHADMLHEYFSIDISIERRPSASAGTLQSFAEKGEGSKLTTLSSSASSGDTLKDANGQLNQLRLWTIPCILDGYLPDLNYLPTFVTHLATHVDWSVEKTCFHMVLTELASFYAVKEKPVGNLDNDSSLSEGSECTYDEHQHEHKPSTNVAVDIGCEDADNNNSGRSGNEPWRRVIGDLLYAAAKLHLRPSVEDASHDLSYVRIASLPDLYRVFERC